LPEGCHESTRRYSIARILNRKQARENASISRETLLEHNRAILDCEAKGESKGLNPAPPKVY
jgi:hypothetical protein